MSPVDDLDKPISLQAWGYQLKVDNADDARIDEFIKALRMNASRRARRDLLRAASPPPARHPASASGS